MISRYTKFVEAFGDLTPYQVDHLCEVCLCKIEQRAEGQLGNKATRHTLDENDIKLALVEAMRDIVIEINKIEVAQKTSSLSDNLNKMFAIHLMAA